MNKEEYEKEFDTIARNLAATLCCGSDLPEDDYTIADIKAALNEAVTLYKNYISSQHACDSCGNVMCMDRDIIKPLNRKLCNGYSPLSKEK